MIAIAMPEVNRRFLSDADIARCRRHPRAKIWTGAGKTAALIAMPIDEAGLLCWGRRAEIHKAPDSREVESIGLLLRVCPPQQTKGETTCSYRLKHIFEKLLASYCSNGAAIVALHRAGVRQVHRSCSGPNTWCCVSLRWVRMLEQMERGVFHSLTGGPAHV